MMRLLRLGLFAVAFVVVADCASGVRTAHPEDAQQAVVAANARWNEAFNKGDAAAVAALYAPDAKLLPPSSPAVSGTEQIRAFWASLIQKGFGEHAIEVEEVRAEGDLLYEAATWRATGPGNSGGKQTYGGKLLNIFERQKDGSWKSRLHIWN